jgi:MoaA/NifB/PqqE/SkfB family radical SAM enzyme
MKAVDLPGAYLVLDLGNACPLRCAHCIQSEPEQHRHFDLWGQMDPRLAYDLLDELVSEQRRFHTLIMFWLGEPLLHPEFLSIYARAAEVAAEGVFHRIEVHTNAVRMTPEIAEAVVACRGVQQRWHFSLDAVTPEVYRAVKGRDLFGQVDASVRHFLAARAAARNPDLKVAFQFIPQWGNTREAEAFVHRWRGALAQLGGVLDVYGGHIPEGAGDCVFFRQLDALDPARQDDANRIFADVLYRCGVTDEPPPRERLRDRVRSRLGSLNRRGHEPPSPGGPMTCACPFLSAVVHWNGQITVCTRDSMLSLSPGSLKDSSFHDVWYESDALRDLRDAHLRGDAAGLCADCPIPRSANYTGLAAADLQRFLAARG